MSNTANWSYTNVATVRPVTGKDRWGAKTFGPEFTIACTWIAENKQERENGPAGLEFVSKHIIYTEDPRPQYGDEIMFDGSDGWEAIRARTNWDMSFFNEIPDYKLVT
ncbi:hypothetical protein FBF48_10265 [Streptococcus salivarius]|uniref:Head-to-tail stopper n=1 Tax=Streptococcus salivarius TaxID=1304 RepID=A0AAX2UZQ5_STRSL|nr:hypothetical protein [Streptococcus salivarius]TNF65772.1 hypothetical protein FBF48_10265 [Streptococcus salivarius]